MIHVFCGEAEILPAMVRRIYRDYPGVVTIQVHLVGSAADEAGGLEQSAADSSPPNLLSG